MPSMILGTGYDADQTDKILITNSQLFYQQRIMEACYTLGMCYDRYSVDSQSYTFVITYTWERRSPTLRIPGRTWVSPVSLLITFGHNLWLCWLEFYRFGLIVQSSCLSYNFVSISTTSSVFIASVLVEPEVWM